MDTSPHTDLVSQFNGYYRSASSPDVAELEHRVLGCSYGGNSFTDIADAKAIAELLHLDAVSVLLDVGTGSGWPGVFFGKETGCRVVLTDIAVDGLVLAAQRARSEGVSTDIVAASGERLPFRSHMYDAITHSDVLC